MNKLLPLTLALLAAPALAGHPWGGADLCTARRDTVPPGIDPALLPTPGAPGAALLQRYCTQCHELPGPGRHTRAQWPAVLARMEVLMRVSRFYRGALGPAAVPDAGEWQLLGDYLQDHALRPLSVAAPTDGAEALYRAACGDCHAAPDPDAYPAAAWPALLARMDDHRATMARAPLTLAQRTAVARFGGGTPDGPLPAGAGHPGAAPQLPAAAPSATDPSGRLVSLAAFFGLAVLGLWRWRRGRR